jgi:hypothetical protein
LTTRRRSFVDGEIDRWGKIVRIAAIAGSV